MRHAGNGLHGRRLRGLVVVLWRAGLRVHEALLLNDGDLDRRRGSLLVRRGESGRHREVGMDEWAWEQLQPWVDARAELPVGPLFCIISGPTADVHGQTPQSAPSYDRWPQRPACAVASHQLRHAHAVELAREGVR